MLMVFTRKDGIFMGYVSFRECNIKISLFSPMSISNCPAETQCPTSVEECSPMVPSKSHYCTITVLEYPIHSKNKQWNNIIPFQYGYNCNKFHYFHLIISIPFSNYNYILYHENHFHAIQRWLGHFETLPFLGY